MGGLAGLLPRRPLRGATVGLGDALGRQREAPLALDLLGGDQALVLEELQHRVDRTGARAPDTAAAGLELLDHLVAVHRPLAEQGENGETDVATPRARPTAAALAEHELERERAPGTAAVVVPAAPGLFLCVHACKHWNLDLCELSRYIVTARN